MSFILGNIIFINFPLIFSFDLFAFLFYKCRPTSSLPLQFISPLAATSLLSPASLYFFPFLGFCCNGSRPLRESLLLRPWLWCADALRLLSLLAGPSYSSWGEGIVTSWASGAACICHVFTEGLDMGHINVSAFYSALLCRGLGHTSPFVHQLTPTDVQTHYKMVFFA